MAATTSRMEYKRMEVTGAVSVERVERVESPRQKVLIMGPTGAGKSSFIESLGLKDSSKISSNSLDGYTQAVSAYKLNNVTRDGDIFLVDSPGFADTKLSEMSIVSKLQRWIQDNGVFTCILYLTSITQIRLPRSHRQVLETFRALTGVKAASTITIVTTMWDNIGSEEAAKRAEEAYQRLQSDIWKNFIDDGAQIVRFYNTKESALSILDQAFPSRSSNTYFSIEDHRKTIKGSPFEANLLTDLRDRIQNLQSHLHTLHDELAQAAETGNQLLLSDVRPRIQEAQEDLARYQKELEDSNLLPSAPPSTSAPDAQAHSTTPQAPSTGDVQQFNEPASILPEHIPHPQLAFHTQQVVAVDNTAASSAPITFHPIPALVAQHDVVPSSGSPSHFQSHVPSTYKIATPVACRCALGEADVAPQQLAPAERAPGRFARLTELMKCWGDAVGERHDA